MRRYHIWRSPPATALLILLVAGIVAACGGPSEGAVVEGSGVAATDDVGRTVTLPAAADRVISLLPAGTETLFALGAGDVVVGRTRYDRDRHLSHLPSVGGGLDPSLEALVSLRPDLVIAFETASGSRVRPRIEQLGIPVFAIQTEDTADIYRNIEALGRLTGRDSAAVALRRDIRERLASIASTVPPGRRPTVVYVASIDPPIVAGASTYIGELIGVAGGDPLALGSAEGPRWPQISLEALVREQPDIVVLPVGSDPTASVERLRREPGWSDLAAVRAGRVAAVPTDLMSRPGPRIPEIAAALRDAFAEVWPER